MEKNNTCIGAAIRKLNECVGIKIVKRLGVEEKDLILETESKAESNIAYGMCRTVNEGVREAISRDCTIAAVIDTAIFEYPHHPYVKMVLGEVEVGEQVDDQNKIIELKKDRKNFFLWENFVIYTSKLPKKQEDRQKLRIKYVQREAAQLKGVDCVGGAVFGTPSTETDILVKKILSFSSSENSIGTCLIGFNIKD